MALVGMQGSNALNSYCNAHQFATPKNERKGPPSFLLSANRNITNQNHNRVGSESNFYLNSAYQRDRADGLIRPDHQRNQSH